MYVANANMVLGEHFVRSQLAPKLGQISRDSDDGVLCASISSTFTTMSLVSHVYLIFESLTESVWPNQPRPSCYIPKELCSHSCDTHVSTWISLGTSPKMTSRPRRPGRVATSTRAWKLFPGNAVLAPSPPDLVCVLLLLSKRPTGKHM